MYTYKTLNTICHYFFFAVVVNLPHNSLSCTFLLIENTVPKGIRWLHQVTAFPSYAPTARPANI